MSTARGRGDPATSIRRRRCRYSPDQYIRGQSLPLKLHGLDHRVRELNVAAARLTRRVADAAGRPVVVAAIWTTGELIAPLGEQTAEAVEDAFHEQAIALKEGGADIAWIETMFADSELGAAVRAVHRAGLPYVATMSFDSGGRTMMGVKQWTPCAALASSIRCPSVRCELRDRTGTDSRFRAGSCRRCDAAAADRRQRQLRITVMGDDGRVRYDGTPAKWRTMPAWRAMRVRGSLAAAAARCRFISSDG